MIDLALADQGLHWGDLLQEQVSVGIAFLLVGIPVWLVSWRPLAREAAVEGESGDTARRSLIRRGYHYLALFAGVMGVMFASGIFLFTVISTLLGEPPEDLLLTTCWEEHIHPQLNFQTTVQARRGLTSRTFPHDFHGHRQPLPVAIGRVVFIRRVRPSGRITILGIKFNVGKRLAHHYVLARLYTRTMTLKVFSQGRLLKQFEFPFVGKLKL